jgi:hypothetical protein
VKADFTNNCYSSPNRKDEDNLSDIDEISPNESDHTAGYNSTKGAVTPNGSYRTKILEARSPRAMPKNASSIQSHQKGLFKEVNDNSESENVFLLL